MTEESLFHQALAKPPAERAAFLGAACAGQPELRQAVEALLAAHEASGHPLDRPAPANPVVTGQYTPRPEREPAEACWDPPAVPVGTLIAGRFKVLECIGVGGMGTVYVAEQTQPVRRKVALKLVKPGMDSQRVLARFEAERQALALMDHPNIAKVLEAGLTEQGRPFFVMEYIKGVPLTDYCDAARLAVPERLTLFIAVCQAVQHAHQKGIIHRDLKPSNILVALYDGRPVPKVIDFGLAKAMHQPLTEHAPYTAHGMVLGTPLYMSPEQAELNNLDIDTRSDVYALGVILYELLTGATPLDRQRFKDAAWNEMLRMIKEEEPPRPSTRLSGSAALPAIAAQRQMAPVKLARLLRGELDWIVMKALDKDRNRRYETAVGFALDVQRYLAEEPVLAGPPTATYRLRKFLRKYRRGVLMATTLAALLMLSVVASIWLAVRARQAEQRATAEVLKAKQSAAEARAVLEYFQDQVLAAARPENQNGGLGVDVTIRAAVDAAEPQIGSAFQDQPLVEASIRNVLGLTYWYLGEAELAIRQHERSRQLRAELLGPDHPATLESMNNLGGAYRDAGRLDLALSLIEQTLAKRKAQLGPDHPHTLQSVINLAGAYQAAGKLDLALPLIEQTLAKQKASLGPDHPDTLSSMNNLAAAYGAAGQFDQALPLLEQTLENMKASFGPDHPHTLGSMHNLALAYHRAGKLDLALPLFEQALQKEKAKLGPDHPHTLSTLDTLAAAYHDAGQFALALPLCEQAFEKRKARLGPDHPKTLVCMSNLAIAYRAAGKIDQALPLYEQSLEKKKATFGPDHPETLISMDNLASAYRDTGQLDRALPLFEQALAKWKARHGSDDPDTLISMVNLALAYQAAGRPGEAEPLFREALTRARRKLGFAHPNTQIYVRYLASCYAELRQPENVEPLLRELASFWKEQAGADSWQYAGELAYLGQNLLEQQKPADAEPLLRECLLIAEKVWPDEWITFNTRSLLGASLLGQKKYADAEPLLVSGYEGMKEREAQLPPQAKVHLTGALERLVRLYDAWGQKDKANAWRKKLEAAKAPPQPTARP